MNTADQAASGPRRAFDPAILGAAWPPIDGNYRTCPVTAEIVARAASAGYPQWWAKAGSVGYCTRPVHLVGRGPEGTRLSVLARCKNRRGVVCPSCSDLYRGDTWRLVHAGAAGESELGVPNTVSTHPMVFATLTAPSFGAVHTCHKNVAGTARRCHPDKTGQQCRHGKPLNCNMIHTTGDSLVGQPLCADCYDYRGHVEFSWHAPALWHRFTIALRRQLVRRLRELDTDPNSVRLSYVKVAELQARAIPHFHALIRLDDATSPTDVPAPPLAGVDAGELVGLIVQAAATVRLRIETPAGTDVVRFGSQIDAQPVTNRVGGTDDRDGIAGRRVAGYLAKYVTKSVADFGLGTHRISPHAIATLPVSEHVRRILHTIAELARRPGRAIMLTWLHCLGFRGHITTKTRRYSTTLQALRARRFRWQTMRNHLPAELDQPAHIKADDDEPVLWEFRGCGHATTGERLLVLTAALGARQRRQAARDALTDTPPPEASP